MNMSFTKDVVGELMSGKPQKTCCRKAMLFGLFFGARCLDSNKIIAEFKSEETAALAAEILKRQFTAEPEIAEVHRAGRCFWSVGATTKALSAFLLRLDGGCDEELWSVVGFRCAECAHFFLRGVFIALGTVNDPQKGYHLEFAIGSAPRAEALSAFLAREVEAPRSVIRGTRIGLYYKKNMLIADILYYLGAMQSGFEISNSSIEHDIRNSENRATNCVTSNISRAVQVSMRHIDAIERLIEYGKMPKLGDELRYTAELRLENPGVSLSELALMHEPPISKSGLNRRLTKILEEAEGITKEADR